VIDGTRRGTQATPATDRKRRASRAQAAITKVLLRLQRSFYRGRCRHQLPVAITMETGSRPETRWRSNPLIEDFEDPLRHCRPAGCHGGIPSVTRDFSQEAGLSVADGDQSCDRRRDRRQRGRSKNCSQNTELESTAHTRRPGTAAQQQLSDLCRRGWECRGAMTDGAQGTCIDTCAQVSSATSRLKSFTAFDRVRARNRTTSTPHAFLSAVGKSQR